MLGKQLVFLLFLIFFFPTNRLLGQGNYWTALASKKGAVSSIVSNNQVPDTSLYQLNIAAFSRQLKQVSFAHKTTGQVSVFFPIPGKQLQAFRVLPSPIFQAELARKYPKIKTYKAIGIKDPTTQLRFSLTPLGLHATVISPTNGRYMISPKEREKNIYKVYKVGNAAVPAPFNCFTAANKNSDNAARMDENTAYFPNDKKLRVYRLALSCTAEYGNYFVTDTTTAKRDILVQMAIAVNRVNQIFERDLAIRLLLVENTEELIFYGDPKADPWEGEWNKRTQVVIDSIIGNENYDIGHNFNLSGGGNAGFIGSVGIKGRKASAYTGKSNPVGDAFFVDFVAHEMGHQLGAYHTMNFCNRSGSGTSEVEPGSGTSIMSYAGVCPGVNVQAHSSPYFNYVSIREIAMNIQTDSAASGKPVALTNSPPVADAGSDFVIPKGTAFVLSGNASDAEGAESLTYQWTQNDPEISPANSAPQPSWKQGPLYRSFVPSTSLERYFPRREAVLEGNLFPTWEVTPKVERTLNFAFTVRDNGSEEPEGVGQLATDLKKIYVTDKAGPFVVTSQKNKTTWYIGEEQQITWDVANTNVAPVEAHLVDILLSVDGGQHFDIVLAQNVENDGKIQLRIDENIPETNQARLLIRPTKSIFYALNASSFSIEKTPFILATANKEVEICQSETAKFSFNYKSFLSFQEEVHFSVVDLPAGVEVHFSKTSTAQNNSEIEVEISQTAHLAVGTYPFQLVGTFSGGKKLTSMLLYVYSKTFSSAVLQLPETEDKGVSVRPNFSWEKAKNAKGYRLQVSKEKDFSTLVVDKTLAATHYAMTQNLQSTTTYYWRVSAFNPCGVGPFSKPRSFETSSCSVCPSKGNGIYTTGINQVQFNTINNETGKIDGYRDYTGLSTQLERGERYKLVVKVNTAGAYSTRTKIWIDWNANCSFEDPGERYDLGEAQDKVRGMPSKVPLEIEVPKAAVLGRVLMRVSTQYEGAKTTELTPCKYNFDGEVEDYSLDITSGLGVAQQKSEKIQLWPNPSRGEIRVSLPSSSAGFGQMRLYNLQGRKVFQTQWKNDTSSPKKFNLSHLAAGLYFVQLQQGKLRQVCKLIIE